MSGSSGYFESIAEKRIREAQERGEFDNLPGAGKPLPGLDRPYREDWWIARLIEREGLDTSGALNPTLALRKEGAQLTETVQDRTREQDVREIVEDFNRRVLRDRLRPATGTAMPPLAKTYDVEEIVAGWRAHRAKVEAQAAAAPVPQPEATRRRWWRR